MKILRISQIMGVSCVLGCLLSTSFSSVYAAVDDAPGSSSSTGAYTYTTEKIPGAECLDAHIPVAKDKPATNTINTIDTRRYKCYVPSASSAIESVASAIIKYVVFIAGLLGVLSIAFGGILYSIGGASDEGKVKAKKFITYSISGFLLLFFISAILYLVAPWVYQ